MPTNGKSSLVTFLLTLLAILIAIGGYTWATLPDKYVQLDRYKSDMKTYCDRLERIEHKVDILIERGGSFHGRY